MMIDYFPLSDSITSIRSQQIEAISGIEKAINLGCKRIMLSAPTGSGKSKIGESIMRYFGENKRRSMYCSPLNILVDQLELTKDKTTNLITFHNRSYYPCIAKNMSKQCNEGYCQSKICSVTKLKGRNCKSCKITANESLDGNTIECRCDNCYYRKAFLAFRNSNLGNITCSMALFGIDNSPNILIIDEIDDMESFVRLTHSVTVPYHVNNDDFIDHIATAKEYSNSLNSCLKCEKDSYDCYPKNIIKVEKKIESINFMIDDYDNHGEEWIIKPEVNSLGKIRTIYQPVTVERFIDMFFDTVDIVVMMSATPPKRITHDAFVEVGSPFPKEIRQCYFVPLGRFSMQHRSSNIPKLAKWLMQLKGKTLVHCGSYAFARQLSNELNSSEKIWPLLQIPNDGNNDGDDNNDVVRRYDAVNAFKKSDDPNKILLSVKLDRGTDFWELDIQNNVIPVVPWSNPSDQLTQAKNKLLGKSWQDEEVAIKIEQAHGRIHRGIFWKKDYPNLDVPVTKDGMITKRTYITDSNFNNNEMRWWYSRNKKYFSKSFNEVLRFCAVP